MPRCIPHESGGAWPSVRTQLCRASLAAHAVQFAFFVFFENLYVAIFFGVRLPIDLAGGQPQP